MVPYDLGATVITLRQVTAQLGRAAGLDVAHYPQLAPRQTVGLPVELTMSAEDVGDFNHRLSPVPGVAPGTHGSVVLKAGIIEEIKR
jgi:hypothetical protein